jgi:glutamine synthetase
MRMPIEGLHTETGPGVIEAALHYTEALEAADRAALFKTFTKVLAQRRGLMATFMAKWSQQLPGQSGHLHVSPARKDGTSAFHDEAAPHTMSQEMRWFGSQCSSSKGQPSGRDRDATEGQRTARPGVRLEHADAEAG